MISTSQSSSHEVAQHKIDGNVIVILDSSNSSTIGSQLLIDKFKQARNLSLYAQIISQIIAKSDNTNHIEYYWQLLFQSLPKELKSNKTLLASRFSKKIFNRNDEAVQKRDQFYLSESVLKDEKFLLELIRRNPTCLYLVPKKRVYVLEAIKHDVKYLGFLAGKEKKDETFMWNMFLQYPNNLRYASGELLNNPQFAKKVKKHSWIIFAHRCGNPNLSVHARDANRNNREDVIFALKYSQANFNSLKNQWKKDPEIKMVNGIRTDPSLWKLNENWANDKEMILKYVACNVEILKYINGELLNDFEFVNNLIYKHLESIGYIKNYRVLEQFKLSDKTKILTKYLSDKRLKVQYSSECSMEMRVYKLKLEFVKYIEKYLNHSDILFLIENEALNSGECLTLLQFSSDKSQFIDNVHIWKSAIKKYCNTMYEFKNVKYDRQDVIEVMNHLTSGTGVVSFLERIYRDNNIYNIIDVDSEILLIAISKDVECFTIANSKYKSDLNFIRKAIEVNVKVIERIELGIVIKNFDLSIVYLQNCLKSEGAKKVVMAYYDNQNAILQFAQIPNFINLYFDLLSYNLRSNSDFCKKLLQMDLDNCSGVPSLILKYCNFVMGLLREGKSMSTIPPEYARDKNFLHLFFRSYNSSKYLPITHENETINAILIEEMKNNPKLYGKLGVCNSLKSNYDVVLAALEEPTNIPLFANIIWSDERFIPLLTEKKMLPMNYLLTKLTDMDLLLDIALYLVK